MEMERVALLMRYAEIAREAMDELDLATDDLLREIRRAEELVGVIGDIHDRVQHLARGGRPGEPVVYSASGKETIGSEGNPDPVLER